MFRTTVKKSVLGIAVVASAAAVIAPGSASAATITSSGAFLDYSAAPSRINDLQVTLDTNRVTFMENNADQVTSAPAGCLRYDWGTQCSLSGTVIRVHAGDLNDRVIGTINAGGNALELHGDAGNDYVDVNGNADLRAFVFGEDGNDQLYGRQFGDTIYGGNGNDIIGAGAGSDTLNGGPGADRIDAGQDNDFIYARDNDKDYVQCGTGTDWAQVDKSTWYSPVFDYIYPGCETLAS